MAKSFKPKETITLETISILEQKLLLLFEKKQRKTKLQSGFLTDFSTLNRRNFSKDIQESLLELGVPETTQIINRIELIKEQEDRYSLISKINAKNKIEESKVPVIDSRISFDNKKLDNQYINSNSKMDMFPDSTFPNKTKQIKLNRTNSKVPNIVSYDNTLDSDSSINIDSEYTSDSDSSIKSKIKSRKSIDDDKCNFIKPIIAKSNKSEYHKWLSNRAPTTVYVTDQTKKSTLRNATHAHLKGELNSDELMMAFLRGNNQEQIRHVPKFLITEKRNRESNKKTDILNLIMPK